MGTRIALLALAGLTGGAAAQTRDPCMETYNAEVVAVERRFGSETLDPAQQSARREEEVRLQADLNECNRRAR